MDTPARQSVIQCSHPSAWPPSAQQAQGLQDAWATIETYLAISLRLLDKTPFEDIKSAAVTEGSRPYSMADTNHEATMKEPIIKVSPAEYVTVSLFSIISGKSQGPSDSSSLAATGSRAKQYRKDELGGVWINTTRVTKWVEGWRRGQADQHPAVLR